MKNIFGGSDIPILQGTLVLIKGTELVNNSKELNNNSSINYSNKNIVEGSGDNNTNILYNEYINCMNDLYIYGGTKYE